MLASRFRADPFGDFKLEHQRQSLPLGRLSQPANQKRGGDIVGKVRHNPARSRAKRREIQRGRVGLNEFQPIRGFRNQLFDNTDCAGIDFNGSDGSSRTIHKRPCQATRTGADFHNMTAFKRTGQFNNPLGDTGIEQEVLAQRVTGRKIVAVDNGGQRLPGREICHRSGRRRHAHVDDGPAVQITIKLTGRLFDALVQKLIRDFTR